MGYIYQTMILYVYIKYIALYMYTHMCVYIYIYIYIVQIWHPIEYHRNTIHPSIVALHYLSLVPVSLCVILLHCSDTGLT